MFQICNNSKNRNKSWIHAGAGQCTKCAENRIRMVHEQDNKDG